MRQFSFGVEYVRQHFGINTPLLTPQATQNLYRENPERLVDQMIRCLDLNGREAVLDIGCGNGFILREVASRLRDGGRAVALDVSAAMLELAKQSTSGVWVPLEFVEGRAEDSLCTYRAGEFNRVMANFIFHYIEEPDVVCAGIARVLAEGGKAIVTIEARGRTLLELLKGLEAAGIRAIPFKGPVLAMLAYNDLRVRRSLDLDVLVHPSDVDGARLVLLADGFRLRLALDWQQSFVRERDGVMVDLHFMIAPIEFRVPVDFDRFWRRRAQILLLGEAVQTFSIEDTLWALCIQVARDGASTRLKLQKISDV